MSSRTSDLRASPLAQPAGIHPVTLPAGTPSFRGSRSDAINDMAVLRTMQEAIHDKLRDAVAACYAQAVDLKGLDPDQVMEAINKFFAPSGAYQSDNFTEAFKPFRDACEDAAPNYRQAAE